MNLKNWKLDRNQLYKSQGKNFQFEKNIVQPGKTRKLISTLMIFCGYGLIITAIVKIFTTPQAWGWLFAGGMALWILGSIIGAAVKQVVDIAAPSENDSS